MDNTSAHAFAMDTLEAMKDADVAEWQVRALAIKLYGTLLTAADLETVAGWYEG